MLIKIEEIVIINSALAIAIVIQSALEFLIKKKNKQGE